MNIFFILFLPKALSHLSLPTNAHTNQGNHCYSTSRGCGSDHDLMLTPAEDRKRKPTLTCNHPSLPCFLTQRTGTHGPHVDQPFSNRKPNLWTQSTVQQDLFDLSLPLCTDFRSLFQLCNNQLNICP